MTRNWMRALLGGVSGVVLAAALAQSADLQPMVVTNLAGNLRIEQDVPCSDDVDQTTPVTAGRFELTPAEGVNVTGGKEFVLTKANVSFAPFSIHRSCLGFDRTRNYTEVGVQLAQAVSVRATAVGGSAYNLRISRDDFRLFTATVVNGDIETGQKHPSEDVTGTINLTTGAVSLRVVLATRVHFKAGCVPHIGCVINETDDGTLTANITGTIVFRDTDGDGIPDRDDNCPLVANAKQGPVATPVVTPPFGVTLASCADQRIGKAFAVDLCEGGPVSMTDNAPSPFAVGPNVVTWTVVDANRRRGMASQTVTIVDTTDPIFTSVPPDVSLNTCGQAVLGLPKAADDCAGMVGFTDNAPKSFPVGKTAVTWTATDASGNQATASQLVTVVDTVAPTVSCLPEGRLGGTFRVTAIDACTSTPIIRLGNFDIADGEAIQIDEVDKPGVTLVGTVGPDKIRHFYVGKGEAVIFATDPSSNIGSAICR